MAKDDFQIPPEWLGAHDIWGQVEAAIPSDCPPELRKQIDLDCYTVLQRMFGNRRPEEGISASGPLDADLVKEVVSQFDEQVCKVRFNELVREFLLLRIEIAGLKAAGAE